MKSYIKQYPEFIAIDDTKVIRKLRLYDTDDDIGIYYNLLTNFYIGVGWSLIGLITISTDSSLNNLSCYEITKKEFNEK